jgi:hypothetical protein
VCKGNKKAKTKKQKSRFLPSTNQSVRIFAAKKPQVKKKEVVQLLGYLITPSHLADFEASPNKKKKKKEQLRCLLNFCQ